MWVLTYKKDVLSYNIESICDGMDKFSYREQPNSVFNILLIFASINNNAKTYRIKKNKFNKFPIVVWEIKKKKG